MPCALALVGLLSMIRVTPRNLFSSTDYIYLESIPSNLDAEALVDTLKLAHYWDMQDFFQQVQQLLVDGMALWNYEYCELDLFQLLTIDGLILINSH
jgi:hypothetical protein